LHCNIHRDQEYLEKEERLREELDDIKIVAQKIDNENTLLSKKYAELKAYYQT